MPTDVRRTFVLSSGLVLASVVGLVGCGSATSSVAAPTPSAAADTAPPPTEAPTPSPTPETAAACAPSAIKFDPAAKVDLTGTWAGNDGGIYYVRQRGNVIWWNGMSSRDGSSVALGRDWNNVGRGELAADLTIASEWSDVPRGVVDGYGTVNFKVGADASGNLQITKTSETGSGRGDSVWTPCTLAAS